MFKVDSDGAVAIKPAKDTPEASAGWFDPGDPLAPRQPTRVPFEWMNAVQDELIGLAEADGGTIDRADDQQLAAIYGPLPAVTRMLRHDLGRAGQFGIGNGGPVIHMPGAVDAVQAWAAAYSIGADPSPGRWIITWGSVPSGTWVAAADTVQTGRVRFSGSQLGAAVAVVEANVTGTYVVYLETYSTNVTPDSEAVSWRVNIAPLAEYLSDHLLNPYILTFDYDNGTGVISAETVTDCVRFWAKTWDDTAWRLVKDSTGNVAMLDVEDDGGKPLVRLRAWNAADAVDPADVTAPVLIFGRDATTRMIVIPGPAGEDDGAGSGNFGASDTIVIGVGGLADWETRFDKDNMVFGLTQSPAVVKAYLSKNGGSQAAADADSQRPAMHVGDIKLLTAAELEIDLPLDRRNALGDSLSGNVWSFGLSSKPFWQHASALSGATLIVEAPHQLGRSLKGFKVTACQNGGVGNGTNTLTATIVRSDTDSVTGALTAESLAASYVWTGDGTTPLSKTVLFATPKVGAAADRWMLQLAVANGSGGSENWIVTKISAVFALTGLLPT